VDKDMEQFQNDLLESVRQMQAGKAARITRVEVPPIVAVRNASGLSQAEFAALLGVSKRTLQEWEQGRRKPSGAAMTLIRIVQRRPDVLREVLSMNQETTWLLMQAADIPTRT
jgi:putative transcriptional regulator